MIFADIDHRGDPRIVLGQWVCIRYTRHHGAVRGAFWDDVLKAIEGHDERIGACADLGHFIRSGEKPVEVIRLLKGRLYGIHLKDFKEMQEKTQGVILGKGHLDVPAVFAALEQVGFPADGALSLEYEENPQNPLDDIRACLEVAQNALAAAG